MLDLRPARAIALLMCLIVCVFAQAQASRSAAQTMGDDPPPVLGVQGFPGADRLPGEPLPPFALKWGSNGYEDSEFNFPQGTAVDASGNVYIADTYNMRVQKYDGSGNLLLMWGWNVEPGAPFGFETCTSGCTQGSSGSGDGQLSYPMGIAVDFSGNVFVSDTSNNRIQKFDSSGNYLAQWGTVCDIEVSGADGCDGDFNNPYGIGVDSAGNVYVADSQNDRIQKFDGSGTFIARWGVKGVAEGALIFPTDVAVDGAGNFFVVDSWNFRVQKFDSGGTFQLTWGWSVDDFNSVFQICTSGCEKGSQGSGEGQFDTPDGVAIDGAGNVYVADGGNDRVQKFDNNGNYLGKWGSACQTSVSGVDGCDGDFDGPAGIALDASENLFVVDMWNHRIEKFGPGFERLVLLGEWGTSGTGNGQFDTPRGIGVDSSGNVYVADSNNDRIQKFDNDGTYLAQYGSNGTAAGDLDTPWDVAVDGSGNMFIADALNFRIQKFDSAGTFVWGAGWGVFNTGSTAQVCTPGSGCYKGLAGNGTGQFSGPTSIVVDSSGYVHVSDYTNNRVQKYNGGGIHLVDFGSSGTGNGQFQGTTGLAKDGSDNIYLADSNNDRIQKLATGYDTYTYADQLGSIGTGNGQFDAPRGVAVDVSGNIFVADTDNDRLQKFNSGKTFLTTWGEAGTGDGQFSPAEDVAVDSSGNVFVVDSAADRVQKFGPCSFTTTPGSFTPPFGGEPDSFTIDAIVGECGWTATTGDSWITVTSGSGGFGDGTVNISIAANPVASSRAGSIIIANKTTGGPGTTVNITQDPAPCVYGLSPTSASFAGTAGADSVNVTVLAGCAWTAVSNDGWVSVDSGTPGDGNGTVLYSVAAHPGSAARSGSMTIAGQTFTVNQDPQVPDAPTNLACVAMNSTKVQLSWDDNAGNEA